MIAFILTSFLSLFSTACENSNTYNTTSLGFFIKGENNFLNYLKNIKINFIFMEKNLNTKNEHKFTFILSINENIFVSLVKKSKEDTEYKKCMYIGHFPKANRSFTKTVLLENIIDGDEFKIKIYDIDNNDTKYSDEYLIYTENKETISESCKLNKKHFQIKKVNKEHLDNDNLYNDSLESDTFYNIANETLDTIQNNIDNVLQKHSDDETYDSEEENSSNKKKDD